MAMALSRSLLACWYIIAARTLECPSRAISSLRLAPVAASLAGRVLVSVR
jgi:hypothetical protein